MTKLALALIGLLIGSIVGIGFAVAHHPKPKPHPSPASIPTPYPAGSCHAVATPKGGLYVLPDQHCTPGVRNQNVSQANIKQTVCKPGWTATIRPLVSYTNQLKADSMREYGYTDAIGAHEEDHLIPLELGGDPVAKANLWAEPGPSVNPKDNIENLLRQRVCAGQLTLAQAQQEIVTNWTEVK